MRSLRAAVPVVLLLVCTLPGLTEGPEPKRDDVIAALRPYEGPSVPGVDRSTLTGKVMCGYQGWFTAPDDGSGRGWRHYPHGGQFKPGSCGIDLWPDVSELDDDEKYATPFRHADGTVAHVFSSHNKNTVLRHFRWMQEYGLDGVFVQRFGVETLHAADLRHCNTVLSHCREGANRSGRCYAVMYDLSGLPEGGVRHVIEDWKSLADRMKLGRDDKDKAYLRHGGKPVVAVWGIGFNDGRKYTLAECDRLIEFLKHDKQYGGNTVLVGVPSGWRTLDADSVRDEKLHEVIGRADIISPWTVGRYRTAQGVADHAERRWKKDVEWCQAHKQDYLPVVFPGFSWHNSHPRAPLDEIPRQKGRFLWKQYVEAKKAGVSMIYQAMFDEMDEGTAIFKVTNDPPVGESKFVTPEGLPSDHYLWLTGLGGQLLRGEVEATEDAPRRKPKSATRPSIKKLGTIDLLVVETTPVVVKDRLYGMTRERLLARPVPGKWSTQEVVCHLADYEPIYADRMKRVIALKEPELLQGDPGLFAARLAYEHRDVEEELAFVELTRKQMARILRALEPEDYRRRGLHSRDGALTLENLLQRVTAHIPHHAQFIEQKRRALA